MNQPFVHLHVHSQFSLLDGLSTFPKLIQRTKDHGQTAVALTDHGAMHGIVHFYNACRTNGIKPIIGVEAYMAEKSRFDKQLRPGSDQYHLTLLARDFEGYQNLMKLVSLANLEGFSYKPRLDYELLGKYHRGIIATTGCSSGIVPKKLAQGKNEEAISWLKKLHRLFKENFYIEIQSHPALAEVEETRTHLVKLSKDFGIPLLATNDVHYVDPDDAEAQDALLAVQTRKTLDDQNRLSMLDSPDFYLKSTQEMYQALGDYPESLKNTAIVADQCNVTIPIGKMVFPEYPLKPGQTPETALKELSHERFSRRFPAQNADRQKRLEYELEVICSKGYASYFLIVQDFVNWAKAQGIRVGPGRGSAAGSLVSYVLRITSIDPLRHNLPFERFMNPQRPSPPDIDIDIADDRRDEVIRYVAQKYGEDHVAQIITFGTMEARAAIRDIGRVMGMPYSDPDKVAKLVPLGFNIDQALTNVFELQELYKEPKYKKLLDLVKKVEGIARHASTHAAAVVIADKPLVEYTPIQRETKGGKIVTQYDMYALDLNISDDAIGLLKMDFLGLRNLSILGRAIEFVKHEQNLNIDLSDLPLDDLKVYELLARGDTTGVFQLESPGMRRVARSLKPERFSDITAMVALYRPGPMQLIDEFIKGKHDKSRIKYPHKDLQPVLEETYGIPVYQEQVLQIANVFAGYSLGEADILRRAIGKKKKSILDKEKQNFVKGASAKGYTKKDADKIWGFIDKFAGYGFNKAHSASYAMIAYQTAYMKVNFPVEYMAALLTTESNSHSATKDEKVTQAIDECQRMGIKVMPPDINRSAHGFTIESHPDSYQQKAIRFGLSAIKNVGTAAVDAILEVRDHGFGSVTDFFVKVDARRVNKKVVECLIRSGAFDQFSHRGALIAGLEGLRETAQSIVQSGKDGQDGLFDAVKTGPALSIPADKFPKVPDLDPQEKLADEKRLLGVYLSDHPLKQLSQALKDHTNATIAEILESTTQETKRIGGLLVAVRKVMTKTSNAEMAFATLEDQSGSIDLVIFPKTFDKIKQHLVPELPVVVSGKIDTRSDKRSFIVNSIELLSKSPPPSHNTRFLYLTIPRGTDPVVLKKIGAVLKKSPGDHQAIIYIENGDKPKTLTLPYTVNANESLKQQLLEILPGLKIELPKST